MQNKTKQFKICKIIYVFMNNKVTFENMIPLGKY